MKAEEEKELLRQCGAGGRRSYFVNAEEEEKEELLRTHA